MFYPKLHCFDIIVLMWVYEFGKQLTNKARAPTVQFGRTYCVYPLNFFGHLKNQSTMVIGNNLFFFHVTISN